MTVEQMLDDNVDPTMALQMTGLKFQDNNLKAIDPRYLEMVQERSNNFNEDDEELGLRTSST